MRKKSYYVAMLSKRIFIITVSLLLFIIFILLTDPQEISLVMILVPFILLGIAFYNILILMIERFITDSKARRKIRIFGLIGTIILINFALLSSVGQLTLQDTILSVLIIVLGGFYLYKFQIG